MIDSARLDQTFVQINNSCVLSSYGIVANYFNAINIPNVFTEYCQIFLLPFLDEIEHEFSSSTHLNCICHEILHWKGCQMINYLHNLSNNAFYLNNRGSFTASVLKLTPLAREDCGRLFELLFDNESLANITTGVAPIFHSLTIGCDEKFGLFKHDTLAVANNKISIIDDLYDLNIQDCITYQHI